MKNYLIEISIQSNEKVESVLSQLKELGFVHDKTFSPKKIRVPIKSKEKSRYYSKEREVFLIKGQLEENDIERVEELEFVVKCWYDTKIAPFICKCNNGKKKTLEKVAECIGAKELWGKGFRGNGITIGIVDGGVDRNVIPQVTNGHLPDWGTISDWGEHGNMTATDALGIAPDAEIFDLRLTPAANSQATIANAIDAYDWAIDQFITNGTPQILSNSWGIFQENWDIVYATDINHPFTRMVEDAVNQGIAVLFAAGNCGETCPDGVRLGTTNLDGTKNGRCNEDTGGGRDIWGANGHPDVMTIAAVNYNWKRLEFSSQGPAALDERKPDFCGYSRFKGYFDSGDGGTSAACPIVAGVTALLLNVDNNLTPRQIKNLLSLTAIDIQDIGWDTNTGHGIVRANRAYYELRPEELPDKDFRDKVCTYIYNTKRQCSQWADEGSNQCSQWADEGSNQCSQWADEGTNECSRWADEGSNQCSAWEKCKWYTPWNCIAGFFCKAWYWVAKWVCKAWYWVAKWVCKAWYWVAKWVCKAWYWVANWVCKLYVTIITVTTLSNCKCRTTYVKSNQGIS